eukprot:s188_g7.t1
MKALSCRCTKRCDILDLGDFSGATVCPNLGLMVEPQRGHSMFEGYESQRPGACSSFRILAPTCGKVRN